jgi:hypothetical protein
MAVQKLALPMPYDIDVDKDLDDKNISASISKTWTDQAIKCHLTQADCANCSVKRGNYSFTCQMDKVVPILVELLGQPDGDRVEKLRPFLHD